jgi:hypothetical protein
MHRDRVTTATWVLIAMGLVANVSFWLYCRQCRYYGLAIFLSTAIAYLYLHSEGRRRAPALIGTASTALFASNYLIYAAVYAAIGVDWLIWGRKQFRPGPRGWMWIWGPQILLNVPIFWTWCPLEGSYYAGEPGRVFVKRVELFLWCLRDMDTSQFGVMLLVCAAPLLWFWRRDRWLLRAPLAAFVYVTAIVLISPQRTWLLTKSGEWTRIAFFADVRFLCPLILLLIAISAMVIRAILPPRQGWLAIPVGVVVFFTDAMHVGPMFEPGSRYSHWSAQSTPLNFAQELIDPPTDPYTVAAAWINKNVKEGQSIFVLPDFMCYPLMFHAPQALYAWQFDADKRAEHPTLPAIDFKYNGSPDYVVVFGQGTPPAEIIRLPNQDKYEMVKLIDIYGQDLYKPELFSHSFRAVRDFDPMVDGIRIYRRIRRSLQQNPGDSGMFH